MSAKHINTLEFDFSLLDGVRIFPLERDGVIVGLHIYKHATEYTVRYFDNAEIRIENFYTDELGWLNND